MALRIITQAKAKQMTEEIRSAGMLSDLSGRRAAGPVTMLYVVCRRKDLNHVIGIARKMEPDAFTPRNKNAA
jgi:uncharacterized membrane-anchored protein YitT (DUF2179 family)